MTLTKLDMKDKKILEALDLNARYFISDIAKKVQLNKEVVKYRIHNLEKKGIIVGYNTIINYSKLGLVPIRISFNLMDANIDDRREIIEFLKETPNLQSLRECDVRWDIVFVLVMPNIGSFQEWNDEFNKKFRRFIEFKQISFITQRRIFSRTFTKDSEKKQIKMNSCAEKEDFDEVDVNILKILAYDAKRPLIDIAKNLKLDSMTVKRRIDTMIKKGIIAGFRTKMNPKAIGFENYSVRLQLFDTEKLNLIHGYVASLPQTIAIKRTIGGYDFEFDTEVQDYFEFEDLIKDLRKNFPFIREIIRFTTLRKTRPRMHEELDSIVNVKNKD